MQADADYVGCRVGDEPLSQFERGLDLGVHKIIRIALLLGPSHEFWNLSLWNSELPGLVCNRPSPGFNPRIYMHLRADTYNATAEVAELRRAARDYKDHDRSRRSLLVFGYGDGGGGPTPRMLETLRRARDLEGLPRTAITDPERSR